MSRLVETKLNSILLFKSYGRFENLYFSSFEAVHRSKEAQNKEAGVSKAISFCITRASKNIFQESYLYDIIDEIISVIKLR